MSDRPVVSLVIPVFNEIAALPELVVEITTTMDAFGRSYECVFVDDGSTDGTAEYLDVLAMRPGTPIRPVHFARNRGQGASLFVGLQRARGEIVVTLDGDGQNCPADIPMLVNQLERDGVDLVCGVRAQRSDSAARKLMSRVANAIRARVLGDGVRDAGCGLKVMRRAVVPALIPLRTLYSFIPALAVGAGFSVAEVPVRHRRRNGGQSSYGVRAFWWRPLVDMIGVGWYQRRSVMAAEDCHG